jgi:muramidase (phage lysozyme)
MDWQNALQSIKQFSLPRTRALRQELDEVRAEHAQVSAELTQAREEYARTRDSDHQQIAALQLQVNHIEADRDHLRKQSQLLEISLQQASQRQEQYERRTHALEAQLEEARHQHESNLYLSRDVLQRMQSEQKNLWSLQSDMARTFHEVSHELLKSLHEQVRPRLSILQMSAIAGLLFLSGALAAALVLHDTRNYLPNLSGISSGIGELQLLMQAHFRTHDELLQKLTRAIENSPQPLLPDTGLLQPGVKEDDDHAGSSISPGADSSGMDRRSDAAADPQQPLSGEMRSDLQVLGLATAAQAGDDTSANTANAMQQFRILYRQEATSAADQAQVLHDFADLAHADALKFKIDSSVLAAIRLASLRTGVEFSYLMELASVESDFNPHARARTSTASGLYQFKEESWLDAIKLHGGRYGLADLAARIEYAADDTGILQPLIRDSESQRRALALRLEPHYAALLAAEQVRDSRKHLASTLDREPRRTDLYLIHFFGASGAISFLKALHEDPDQIAGEIFPGPAQRNSSIFRKSNQTPRTVAEIYQLLNRKFNTKRYEES